jgi:hypothetical protein
MLAEIRALPGARAAAEDRPGVFIVTTNVPLDLLAALAAWRDRTGATIAGLRVTGASLEDIFLQITGEEVRD